MVPCVDQTALAVGQCDSVGLHGRAEVIADDVMTESEACGPFSFTAKCRRSKSSISRRNRNSFYRGLQADGQGTWLLWKLKANIRGNLQILEPWLISQHFCGHAVWMQLLAELLDRKSDEMAAYYLSLPGQICFGAFSNQILKKKTLSDCHNMSLCNTIAPQNHVKTLN